MQTLLKKGAYNMNPSNRHFGGLHHPRQPAISDSSEGVGQRADDCLGLGRKPQGPWTGSLLPTSLPRRRSMSPGAPLVWWMIIGYAGGGAVGDHWSGFAGRGVCPSAIGIWRGSSLGRVRASGHGQTHHVASSRLGNCLRMVRERAPVMGVSRNSCHYQ